LIQNFLQNNEQDGKTKQQQGEGVKQGGADSSMGLPANKQQG